MDDAGYKNLSKSVKTDELKKTKESDSKDNESFAPIVDETNLTNNYSHVCPACGGHLDFWACEALCHYCGLKFTCDE